MIAQQCDVRYLVIGGLPQTGCASPVEHGLLDVRQDSSSTTG